MNDVGRRPRASRHRLRHAGFWMALWAVACAAAWGQGTPRGDVDGNGAVNLADVSAALLYASGLDTGTPASLQAADLAAPAGALTMEDAVMVYWAVRYQLGGGGVVVLRTTNRFSTYGVYLDHPAVNGNPDANILVSHGDFYDGDPPVGVRYDAVRKRWAVYNENLAPMMGYHAFFYAFGPQFKRITRGATEALAHAARLDDPALNGNADAIVLAGHRLVQTPNTSPRGVWYDGSYWWVYNEDEAPMPAGEEYVYVNATSRGGRVIAEGPDLYSNYGIYLNDDRINDVFTAVVLVQHAKQAANNVAAVGIKFWSNRWLIYNEGGEETPMESDEVFHYYIVQP